MTSTLVCFFSPSNSTHGMPILQVDDFLILLVFCRRRFVDLEHFLWLFVRYKRMKWLVVVLCDEIKRAILLEWTLTEIFDIKHSTTGGKNILFLDYYSQVINSVIYCPSSRFKTFFIFIIATLKSGRLQQWILCSWRKI